MRINIKSNRVLAISAFALVAAVCGLGGWLSQPSTAHAAPATTGKMPVWQQIGYAGQVGQTVTGQYPVTFRLFGAGDKLVYEETVKADIRQGRFQVNVGSVRGDLRSVLKDSKQMKVFFEGNLLDSLSVIHTTRDELQNNPKQYSGTRSVIFTDEASGPVAAPQAIAGTCAILQTGFFTIPFTNTTVGVTTPGCGASVAVSGGYSFLTTPSQGVIVFGLFPVVISNWQVNYQVGATPALLQTSTVCCQ
jgi:hypothetical protein